MMSATCRSSSKSSQVYMTRFLDRKSRIRNVSCEYARADHAQPGEFTRFAQQLPAGDECLQNDVAEFGMMIEQLPQGIRRKLISLDGAASDGAHDGWVARQLGHVAGESAGFVNRDPLRAIAGNVDNFHLSRLDDVKIPNACPASNSGCPSRKLFLTVSEQPSRLAIWAAVNFGKATERRSR